MFSFRPVSLADREAVETIRRQAGHTLASHAFASMYMWRDDLDITLHLGGDWFVFRQGGKGCYFPVGSAQGKRAFARWAHAQGEPLLYLGAEDKAFLEAEMPGAFHIEEFRDGAEYIYSVEEQAALSGGKFAHLRKAINRLTAVDTDWQTEDITPANINRVRRVVVAWNSYRSPDEYTFVADTAATFDVLEDLTALGLTGTLLMADGEPAAYILASELSPDTLDIHSAKHGGVDGNVDFLCMQRFCQRFSGRYAYLNREDDMGLPGLRQRKLHFQPISLTEIWRATPLTDANEATIDA